MGFYRDFYKPIQDSGTEKVSVNWNAIKISFSNNIYSSAWQAIEAEWRIFITGLFEANGDSDNLNENRIERQLYIC